MSSPFFNLILFQILSKPCSNEQGFLFYRLFCILEYIRINPGSISKVGD